MKEVKRTIHVLGLNSFEFEELSINMQNLFKEIDNIAVPGSYISNIKKWAENYPKKEKIFFESKSDSKLINWLKNQKKNTLLISRGDPHWFGIGRNLLQNFHEEELMFYPANTCLQKAFSKLKRPWQETTFISIHGRDNSKLISALKSKVSSLAVITDSKNNGLEIIKKNLIELKLDNFYDFWLCEEIGFINENIRKINIKNPLPNQISDINIVVLLRREEETKIIDLPLFGIKDDVFKTFEDRPNLLTKREIRIQILADLELSKKGVIWDIGAGCGSIGLEALKISPNLKLLCIDKRIGSRNLIIKNARNLGVYPEEIIEDDIKNLLKLKLKKSIQRPNRIIIGGANKKTKIQIINQLSAIMKKGNIVVIPIIEIEALRELKEVLIDNNFHIELNLIQTYRSLSISEGTRFEPNNPVFILKGKKFG